MEDRLYHADKAQWQTESIPTWSIIRTIFDSKSAFNEETKSDVFHARVWESGWPCRAMGRSNCTDMATITTVE